MIEQIDAIILCGGLGTRLRTVCDDKPKVLVNIGEKPFIDLLIEYLSGLGLNRFILAVGYKAESIREYYFSNNRNYKIEFSHEDEPLGTGGAVLKALDLVKSSIFFVLNGDSFCEFDAEEMVRFHLNRNASATVLVRNVENISDYGRIIVDDNNRVVSFNEKSVKAVKGYVNAGVYIFNKNIGVKIPDKKTVSLEKEVFPGLIGCGFYAFKSKGYFIDIGTPARFNIACEYFKKR